MTNIERRYRPHAEVRLEAAEETPGMLAGFAVVYDSPSEDLGGFTEIIKPGAFVESLKTADVRCLIDHNPSLLLGRLKSGTLRLFDGPDGLRMECDLPNTSYATDLAMSIKRGDLTAQSFGFIVCPGGDTWEPDKDGKMVRTVIKADIFDVSAVTFPAYTETSLALRSLDTWKRSRPDPDETRRLRLRINESTFR
jgi:Escherichia/Staphylococcus phage prohead protease